MIGNDKRKQGKEKRYLLKQKSINDHHYNEAFSYSSDRFAISSLTEIILSTR